jgi:hypothetical protein
MNKRNVSFGTPGGSALMVTFAVLCLVVFAVLSLSTAQADRRLSEVSADAVRQYYEADREANRILSLIRKGSIPAGVETEEGIYRYSCRISDTRTLFVEVRVDGSDYEILRWQEEYTADWELDTSLDVWSGN